MKSMTQPLAEIGEVVTAGVTDAWAATSALAQELAASAANAVEVVHPKPAKRQFSPWLLVLAGITAAVTAGWWIRRQKATTPDAAAAPVTTTAPPTATPRVAAGA